MSAIPSPDKNEPSTIYRKSLHGRELHKACEFTCSTVQYGRQKYGLFCKTRPPVSFVMSTLGEGTIPLCKPTKNKESCGGFWCGIGCAAHTKQHFWNIVLLPNPISSTAKTSLPWHTTLWMHSICSSLRALWTKLSGEAFKADKNSLSLLASSDVMMEFVSSRDFFDRKSLAHRKPMMA